MQNRQKIVLAYAAFAALWIFGSDRLLTLAVHDPLLLGWIGTSKGFLFVVATSWLLYLLLRAEVRKEVPVFPPVRDLVGVFLLLVVIFFLIGFSIVHLYTLQLRQAASAGLSAGQLAAWMAEWRADAGVQVPVKYLVFWVGAVAVAIIAAGAGAALFWGWRQQRMHREKLLAQANESGRLLKLFFDLPFVGMAITSPATKRWLHVNDCLCALLGYTREELTGLTWVDVTHPDDIAANIVQFERALSGEVDGYQLEKRFVRKDGAIIYVTLDVKAVRRADHAVDVFVTTVQDITLRRRMEVMQRGNVLVLEALVRNEPLDTVLTRLTELIGNALPGAIGSVLLLDADGKHLRRGAVSGLPEFFNQAVDGAEIGEGVGSCGTAAFRGARVVAEDIATDRLWENYRELAAQANLRACWSEPIISSDSRVLGTFTVYFSEPRRLGPDDDKLLRAAANLAALAIQGKQTEQALRESEARFRAIVDTEPECVKIMGPDGRLTFMNRTGLDMMEADSVEQVQERSLLEIVTPDYREAFQSLVEQILQGERGFLQFEIVGLKGTRRFLETHAVALPDSDGKHFSLLGVTRDITERKKMEGQLRQRLDELTRWQAVMLGREDRVEELKREVNDLLIRLDEPIRYPSQAAS